MDTEFLVYFEDFFRRINYRFIEDIEIEMGIEYDIFNLRKVIAKILKNNPKIVDPRDVLLYDLVLENLKKCKVYKVCT